MSTKILEKSSEAKTLARLVMDAGPGDLAAMNAAIAEAELELDKQAAMVRQLKVFRNVLDAKLNGKRKGRPRKIMDGTGGTRKARLGPQIYDYISVNGPTEVRRIAAALGITAQGVVMAVGKSVMLDKVDDVISIRKPT